MSMNNETNGLLDGLAGYKLNLTNPDDCNYFGSQSIFSTSWFRGIIYFVYSTVFVIALTGNGLVCYVVHSSPRMKTVTNFFIVNLALGDILIALFCVPTSSISTLILQYWPFGPELCPTVIYLQAVSVLVSAYTLVAISIDRYIAIMWPLKPRLSKRQAQLLILAVWMLAMVISLPIAIVSKLFQPSIQYKRCNQYICIEVWPSLENRYYYSIALLVLQYVIPITVLVFTYTSIAIMVWGKRPPGEAENIRDQRMARSKRKMVKMMVTVVIVFTVCWLPFNILNLIMDNNETLGSWTWFPFVWMILHWLAMSHSCYNPVIYCWMNARFRAGFITAISHLPGTHRILRRERRDNYNASLDIPLTGFNDSNHSVLRRMNTCTTYISVRRKANGNHTAPARSASFRNDSFRPMTQQLQRQFTYLESHTEEQL
ncbi:RYamide receptor-like isoform X1 [Apis laboriosa]|uniref:RYamide receptor-like isoform X1 n=1 Tax=Apis laboriosa TaxID=183418 RepID=UPI001CC4B434|nr:RYamide receptor-like isoform X1 [Apis laboriosa]XP_043801553.1 RYamide receptor-like isoform X1 [Apis laboriosa]XP_043801554.1 RYamide receptor-like isoform X1 [Apis laboriosa]